MPPSVVEELTVEEFLAFSGVTLETLTKTGEAVPYGFSGASAVSATSFRLVANTAGPDRKGHRLNPKGCDLTNFVQNPMFLWEHGKKLKPDESVLGRVLRVIKGDDCIKADVEYIPLENNPMPGKVLELEQKGLIPGNSIGWLPLGDIRRLSDGTTYIGQWELIEISKVLLGMNGKATTEKYIAV